jgi:hypothetical protein
MVLAGSLASICMTLASSAALKVLDEGAWLGWSEPVVLVVQRSLSFSLHNDDPGGLVYLELEVGIAGDGHELDVTWPPQDDMVRPREIDNLKRLCLGAVVACVSEGDRQGDPPEWNKLLARDHSVESMWAALELVLGKP